MCFRASLTPVFPAACLYEKNEHESYADAQVGEARCTRLVSEQEGLTTLRYYYNTSPCIFIILSCSCIYGVIEKARFEDSRSTLLH